MRWARFLFEKPLIVTFVQDDWHTSLSHLLGQCPCSLLTAAGCEVRGFHRPAPVVASLPEHFSLRQKTSTPWILLELDGCAVSLDVRPGKEKQHRYRKSSYSGLKSLHCRTFLDPR